MTIKQRIGQVLFRHLPIARFLFDQLRVEMNGRWATFENKVYPSRRRLLANLRRQKGHLVNVACGPQVLADFVNVDLFRANKAVVKWDCRRSLPFADGSVAGIRVEHFVEHLEVREELTDFLSDCHRILQPHGVLRVIVPDAEKYLRAYCDGGLNGFALLNVSMPLPADLPTRMDVVNHVFHQGHEHRWGYDFENLSDRLKRAGFLQIRRTAFGQSTLPPLACDREVHKPYSLYVEASR